MPRFVTSVVVLVLAGVAVASGQPVFRSGVDLVRFGVTVLDNDGELVSGLTADDFRVVEEGREQRIAYFSRGLELDRDLLPLHLGVLFDVSGSMTVDAAFAKTAAIRFLRGLDFAVDMTLVEFDTQVRVSRFIQADFPRLVERLRGQEAEGMTALYDALGVYLDGAFGQDGRKLLLLYSDGADTRSRLRFGELRDLLRASDVTVYAIGFQVQRRNMAQMRQRVRLQQIAELTGGRAYFPTSPDDLDEIYQQIREELEARYSLGYVSTDPTTDGAWRRVTVSLRGERPELDDADIRAREGYFAPYIEETEPRGR
jgi:Ca-activated chloride channel family protein